MHRTLLPKIRIIIFLFAALTAIGQSRPASEVDPARCWTYPAGDDRAQEVYVADPHVFLGFSEAKVDAIYPDGRKAWSSELGGEIRSNILESAGTVFVVTATTPSEKGKPSEALLRSLSSDTGLTTRTQKLASAGRFFLGAVEGALIVVSSSGTIESLSTANGNSAWRREIAGGFIGEPVMSAGKITVAATSNQIFVVSVSGGEIESVRKMPFAVTAVGRTAEGTMIVGDERGSVFLYDGALDKPLWKFKSGGAISNVSGANGNILAVSNDNFVYLLNDRNGDVIWKKRLPGRAAAARVYENKYVVVAGFEEHDALLLDASKGKVAGQIKLSGDETVTDIQTAPTSIFVLTSTSLYSYALDACAKK